VSAGGHPFARCLEGHPDRWSAGWSRRAVCSYQRAASLAWAYHRTDIVNEVSATRPDPTGRR